MKKSLLLILPLLMLAAVPRAHGAGDRACLDRTVMIDTLITEYGEQLAEVREIKAVTHADTTAREIALNIARFRMGTPMSGLVDRRRRY